MIWAVRWDYFLLSSELDSTVRKQPRHGNPRDREWLPSNQSLWGSKTRCSWTTHIMHNMQLEHLFKEIWDTCTVLTNENWYGEKVDVNIVHLGPGMCPCPSLSSLLGQQLVTFKATPWLVSHLFCVLFPFDWQQFKAIPCLVNDLPCLLDWQPFQVTPRGVSHLHFAHF